MPPALAIDRTSWLVGTALPSAFLEFIDVLFCVPSPGSIHSYDIT